MATLISCATGNFTAAATWAVCNSTAENDNDSSNTVTSSSYASGSRTFTPGAITVDGIALKLDFIATGTGTLTVALDQAGSDVAGTVTTINIIDLPNVNSSSGTAWFFMKFAAPVTLVAATLYGVKVKH